MNVIKKYKEMQDSQIKKQHIDKNGVALVYKDGRRFVTKLVEYTVSADISDYSTNRVGYSVSKITEVTIQVTDMLRDAMQIKEIIFPNQGRILVEYVGMSWGNLLMSTSSSNEETYTYNFIIRERTI